MKLVCTKENMEKGVGVVSRVIGKNSSLPVLSHVLLETDNGRLKVSATNLEVGAVCWIGCRVEEEGKVTAPAQLLQGVVSSFKDDQITLDVEERNVVLSGPTSHSEMGMLNVDDFPLIPPVDGTAVATLTCEQLHYMLSQVVNACADSESRPEISGVYIYRKDNTIAFVATDSYRLAEVSSSIQGPDFEFVLPLKTSLELMRLSSEVQGEVEIVVSDNQAFFSFPNFYLVSRIIDGQYPDYKQIIPDRATTVLTFEKASLAKAIKAVSLFADKKTNDIKLSYVASGGKFSLTAISSNVGEGKVEEVPKETTGGDQDIVVNYRYLLDGLSNITSPTVKLILNSSSEPAVLRPEDSDDYLYILMPIHL